MGRQIEIGRCGKSPVHIDLETLLKTRMLVQANSGGGKSYALRRSAEQIFGKVPIWIVDPEGEFASLREKHGIVLVGKGGETPADPRSVEVVVDRLLEHGASAVFDLYDLKPQARHHYVRVLCEALMNVAKTRWRPLVFKLDEAHQFAPEKGQGESEAYGAVVDLATRGRKRGFCLVAYTQRLAKISKNVTAELLNRLIGMTFEDLDVESAATVLSVPKHDREQFKHDLKRLEPGNFYGLGPAISKDRILIKVGPVFTTHPEPGTALASAPPPPPEKLKALLPKLADLPKQAEEKARTESDLRAEIRSLKAQLASRPTPAPARPAPADEKIIEVPVMGKRELARLEKLVEKVTKAKDLLGFTSQSLEIATRDIVATIERLKDGKSTNEIRKSVGLKPIVQKPQKVVEIKVHTTNPPASHTEKYISGSGKALDKCERAILGVLAQYEEGCSIGKISLLAGYRQSGSFMSSLSSLRTNGYLFGNNSDIMKATPTGVDALGGFNPLPVGSNLADYWLRHPSFGACERKILAALLNSSDGLTIDEICEKTGYSASGSFMSSLSSLRTAGVLVGKNSERMRPADDLVTVTR